MRTYKITKEVKEVKHKKETITCDLCGNQEGKGSWGDSTMYDLNETEIEVTVRQKEGSQYPEGGGGEKYVVDLCPDCFKSKLVPWLISQGADIKPLDWDN